MRPSSSLRDNRALRRAGVDRGRASRVGGAGAQSNLYGRMEASRCTDLDPTTSRTIRLYQEVAHGKGIDNPGEIRLPIKHPASLRSDGGGNFTPECVATFLRIRRQLSDGLYGNFGVD
jgi:hypothetical protein